MLKMNEVDVRPMSNVLFFAVVIALSHSVLSAAGSPSVSPTGVDSKAKAHQKTPILRTEDENAVAALIAEARRYDNKYAPAETASQQQALRRYKAALEAGADKGQRLYVLDRMAHLYGSGYMIEKGEKPNFGAAIAIYKEIIASYPPSEPLVVRAKVCIGDHTVSLRRPLQARQWYKQALAYDASELAARLAALQRDPTKAREAKALGRALRAIKGSQKIAVKQLAYASKLVSPSLARTELAGLVQTHFSPMVRQTATDLLARMAPGRSLELPPDFLTLGEGAAEQDKVNRQADGSQPASSKMDEGRLNASSPSNARGLLLGAIAIAGLVLGAGALLVRKRLLRPQKRG